jgi:uncharacterized protein (DUF58 family)
MWTKLFNRLLKNLERSGGRGVIYIIPTFDAIKLFVLNGILLIIGLVYANNFILFFNFILFCLFLGSMYYTHFNLRGIKITGCKIPPVHCGESSTMAITLSSNSSLGHYFLNLRSLQSECIEVDSQTTFSLHEKSSSGTISLRVLGKKRGWGKIDHLVIETLFPFHLFRCLIVLPTEASFYVYPRRSISNHQRSTLFEELKNADGESFIIRDFRHGDSLKHIHWKKLAQTQQWYSKAHFTQTQEPVLLLLNDNLDLEEQLSSISIELYHLLQKQIPFGIKLNRQLINPALSQSHLELCQKSLARYES